MACVNPSSSILHQHTHVSNGRKPAFAVCLRRITCGLCATFLGSIALAAGSNGGISVAQIQPLDRFEAEQARLLKLIEGKPRAYEDKVMDPSTLPPQAMDDDAPPDASTLGLRSYAIEGRYGFSQSDNTGYGQRSANEWGMRAEYRLETLNYGEFTVQADARARNGDNYLNFGPLGQASQRSSGRITLRNLGFPITPHTFADTTVGDMYSEVTDALRRHYRLTLGSSTVRGIGTRVFDRNFDLSAGVGERGDLTGSPFSGYERTSGTLAWLGYSHRFDDKLFAGLQINQANGIDEQRSLPSWYNRAENATSVAAALGYGHELFADGDKRARLSLVQSHTPANMAGRNSNAHGVFFEVGANLAGYRHEAGVYNTQPNLRFGDNLLASDNRGVYWRVDRSTSRLSWGSGLDYEQYNPSRAPGRYSSRQTGVHGNAQYRIDRHSSLGISANLTQLRYQAATQAGGNDAGMRTVYASSFYQTRFNDWAPTRFRATLRRNQALVVNDVAATGEQIEWEQDWITGKYETMRPEFTTTLGWARDRSSTDTQTYPTAGVVLRHWFNADWNIGGNLNYTSRSGNLATSRGVSGSVNTEAQLGNGWRAGASLLLNQATIHTTTVGGLPTAQVSRSNDKSFYVYLRWDGSSGTALHSAGLRNPDSAGGGSISGTVFFDENRDGEQQASENGVPNVEVFLDGRYRVTTDSAGRFEFPMVATGGHRLTLRLESVPLPWGAALDQGLGVEVPLRGQATARIPVVRVGGE